MKIRRKKKHKTIVLSILFAVLGTVVGILLLSGRDRISFAVFDFIQRSTLLEKSDTVALIHFDDASIGRFAEEGIVPPIPRQLYGAVAEMARRYDAAMLVFDILFTEPSSYGVADDRIFSEMLKSSKVPALFPAASASGKTKQPVEPIFKAAAGLGSVNSENDSDGVFRRYLSGNSIANIVFQKMRPQMSAKEPQYMRFYGKEAFAETSLYNVIKAYRNLIDGQPQSVDLNGLKGKIWVVGYSATALYDLKPIPANPKAAGMLIPATAIANRLSGEGLDSPPPALAAVLCLLMATLSMLLVRLQRGPYWAGVVLFGVGIAGSFAIAYLFWIEGFWISPVPLAASSLTAGIGATVVVFQSVWRSQLRLAKMVQHSMSSEMVELIRNGEVNFSRFGEMRQVTVLFTDLVGFTELSEKLPPQELVKVLNGYFDEVVHLVTEASGYVDKFIGDAVMALWGAPIPQQNHASLALNAAIHFHRAVERYNEKLEARRPDLNPLGTRLGLHSGPAVVGNIGARHRHNYTAVGDTVNLAARLESLCKNYGINLIISEDCLVQAGALNQRGIIEIDLVMVKGKSQPTRIFTYSRDLPETEVVKFKNGLKAYYKAEWSEALRFFEGIEFAPARLLETRCRKALGNGQLDQWENGVWIYDTK